MLYIFADEIIYSELYVIYFENNPDDTAMTYYKNKLAESDFQACCKIFNIIIRSLKSINE